jgi:hypothetical protein
LSVDHVLDLGYNTILKINRTGPVKPFLDWMPLRVGRSLHSDERGRVKGNANEKQKQLKERTK